MVKGLISIANAILGGKGNGFGTFHLSGEPSISRFEFLQAIMEAYAPYTTRRPRLTGVTSDTLAGRVPRPAYSVLDNQKLYQTYGIAPRAWRDDLTAAIQEIIRNREISSP